MHSDQLCRANHLGLALLLHQYWLIENPDQTVGKLLTQRTVEVLRQLTVAVEGWAVGGVVGHPVGGYQAEITVEVKQAGGRLLVKLGLSQLVSCILRGGGGGE